MTSAVYRVTVLTTVCVNSPPFRFYKVNAYY
jgi:uncharacterized protein YpiB (UPF0302 family)